MIQAGAGSRIGEFTLMEQIGQGGSGQVWRAKSDEPASESVAVKIFDRSEEASGEAERLRAAAAVSGIGQLVADGPGWLATQWVEGRTLAHLIETEGPLAVDRTLRLMDQLAATLDELHAVGLVHGDLSPSNALVDLHDRLTLVDLGPTSVQPDDVDTTTQVAPRTTPRYASPEVAAGAHPEPASDRYALALIAYEALSGSSPFPPVASSMAMLGHHVSSQPEPISERAPSLGTRYDNLFERGLSKLPERRHSDAKGFVDELRSQSHALVRQRSSSANPKLVVLGLAAIAAVIAGVMFVGSGSDSNGVAGMAAGAACNLWTLPGFEGDQLPANWYQGDPENSIALVPGAGVDRSTALQVGTSTRYGLTGERVQITAGDRYHFSAWVRLQGEPNRSGMWLEYETAADEQIEGVEELLFGPLDGLADGQGQRITRFFDPPAGAVWAVPTFFKDASAGSLLIDEVVFGPASACDDVPT